MPSTRPHTRRRAAHPCSVPGVRGAFVGAGHSCWCGREGERGGVCAPCSPAGGRTAVAARTRATLPRTTPLRAPHARGILNGPATGLALAELIADGAARSVHIEAFDPARAGAHEFGAV